jgi:Cdc6-like AAA superfamily ATPase
LVNLQALDSIAVNSSGVIRKRAQIRSPVTCPFSSATRIARTFSGVSRYNDWLSNQSTGNFSRVFRIEGGPGMGKTAVTSYLVHSAKSSVLAVHLCKSGSSQTHNPHRLVMSLAYQIATRLPDYRARLLKVPCSINPALLQGV